MKLNLRLLASLASLAPLSTFASITQTVSSYCQLSDQSPSWRGYGSYVTPASATLQTYSTHSMATFSVAVPRGYMVSHWSWAAGSTESESASRLMSSDESQLAGKLVTSATEFVWSSETNSACGSFPALGVRLDPIPYNIAFAPNGGAGTMETMHVPSFFIETNLTENAFAKTGYSYVGWTTNTALGAVDFYDGQSVTGACFDVIAKSNDTVTLYACWKANDYTVSFDPNGGTVSPESKSVTYDSTYGTLPTPTWERTGYSYEFDGWYTAVSGGSRVEDATKVSMPSNHTLYARWTQSAQTYTVSFDSQGGSMVYPKTVTYGSPYGSLSTPTREGYGFNGWFTEGGTLVEAPTNVTIAADHTLYAQWTAKTVVVTFDPQGGTCEESARTVTYDQPYDKLPVPTRANYSFTGWFTASAGGIHVESNTVVQTSANHTLYAQWAGDDVEVTFAMRTESGGWSNVVQRVSYGGAAVPPKDIPVWVGHQFTGWYPAKWDEVKASYTEYAQYAEYSYILHFDGNGGTCTVKDRSLNYTQTTDLPREADGLSRIGYTLAGWSREEESTEPQYAPGETVSSLTSESGGNITLYAVWQPIVYQIAFDANVADTNLLSGTMDAMTNLYYDVITNLPPNAYTNKGHVFLHWQFGTTNISDCAAVSNLTATAGETVTLKAVWEAPYWIRFEPNGGEGTMDVSPRYLVGETNALPAQTFTRKGYAFSEWQATTNGIPANFEDGAKLTGEGFVVGETNVLTAAWKANTYSIKYCSGWSDATGEMKDSSATYDTPASLASNGYSRGEFWSFAGWSNTVSGVVYEETEEVSNLTATANATVTLVALWKENLSDLSIALDCDNLRWETSVLYSATKSNLWVVTDEDFHKGATSTKESQNGTPAPILRTMVSTNGVLTFYWMPKISPNEVNVILTNTVSRKSLILKTVNGTANEWNKVEVDVTASQDVVLPAVLSINSTTGRDFVDDVQWVPEGGNPPAPTPLAPPSVPTGLQATDGTSEEAIEVSWQPVEGATQYVVWRATTNDSAYAVLLATTNATSYSDTQCVAGVTYWYGVTARNDYGESAFSPFVRGSLYVPPPPPPPGPVTTLVSFDANGGTGAADPVVVTNGEAMTQIEVVPTRAHYSFTGYFDAPTAGTMYYTALLASARNWDKTDETATLYAQWDAESYVWNIGGKEEVVRYGEQKSLSTAAVEELGPYTNRVCTGWIGTGDIAPSGTTNVTPVFTVTQPSSIVWLYQTNFFFKAAAIGGTVSVLTNAGYAADAAGGFVPAGTNVALAVSGDMEMFRGWRDELSAWTSAEQNINLAIESPHSLIAQFDVRSTSVISFDGNGAVISEPSVAATNGLPMPVLSGASSPTRTGYSFVGYFDDRTGGTCYYDASRQPVASTWDRSEPSVTLFANWKVHAYSVAFDPDSTQGGYGEMDALAGVAYGESRTLPMCTFGNVNDGMRFAGWARTRGGAVVFEDGASISNLTDKDGEVITLYAVWRSTPTAVAFEASAAAADKSGAFVLAVSGGSEDDAVGVTLTVTYANAKASDLNLGSGTVADADGDVERTGLAFPLTLTWDEGEVGVKTITIPTAAGKATDAPKYLTWNLTGADGLPLGEPTYCIGTIRAGASYAGEEVFVLPYVADVTGGKVSGGASSKPNSKGAYRAVTLKATPNKGYWFMGWYDASGEWVSSDLSFKVTPDGSAACAAYEARFTPAHTSLAGTYNGFVRANLKGMSIVKNADTTADVIGEYPFVATLSTAGKLSGSITVGGKKVSFKADACCAASETVELADWVSATYRFAVEEKLWFGASNVETLELEFSRAMTEDEWTEYGVARLGGVSSAGAYAPLAAEQSGFGYRLTDKADLSYLASHIGTYAAAFSFQNGDVMPLSLTVDRNGKVKATGKYVDGTTLSMSGTLACRSLSGGDDAAEALTDLFATPKALGKGSLHVVFRVGPNEDGETVADAWCTDVAYTADDVETPHEECWASVSAYESGCWVPTDEALADPDYGALRLISRLDDSIQTNDILYATKNGQITGLGASLQSGVKVAFVAKTGIFTVTKTKDYTIQGILGDYASDCRAAGRIDADGTRSATSVTYVRLDQPQENFPWTDDGFSLTVGQTISMQPTVTSDSTSFALKISGLPTGLKYDSKTGLITGVPTRSGTSTVRVSYTYGSRTITRVTTFVVAPKPDELPSGTYAGTAVVFLDGEDKASPVSYPLTVTIGNNGSLSGSLSLFGKKATIKASGYDTIADGCARYTATLDLKAVNRAYGAATMAISVTTDDLNATVDDLFGDGYALGEVAAARSQTKDAGFTELVSPYVGSYVATFDTMKNGVYSGVTTLSFVVDKKGAVKLSGKFADGASFSASSTLAVRENGERTSANVRVSVVPKTLAQGALSFNLSLAEEECAVCLVTPISVSCSATAAAYVLKSDLYTPFSLSPCVSDAYASSAWVDESRVTIFASNK